VIETSVVADIVQDRKPVRREDTSIEELVYLVRDYAKQETVGPLRGAGQWIAYGAVGALLLGIGLILVLLGLLRLLQAEWDRAASGSLSWLAYLVVLVVCVIAIIITVSRINKPSLNKGED
jgi:Putative Actinobacterial Holin-X, holin superfamily III